MPYDRYLPGEIMFLDLEDIAECLTWDLDRLRMRLRLRDLGRKVGWPHEACWVMATRKQFLVTGDLAELAAQARCHGLTVAEGPDGELRLQEKGDSCQTVVRLLDRDPPHQASPRWWLEQEAEWTAWYKTATRHAKSLPNSGSGKLSPHRPTSSEIAGMIRCLAEAGDGRVMARDLVAWGVPKSRAAVALRLYYGPDLTRMEPDRQGLVTGLQVQDAYRITGAPLRRSVQLGRLKLAGTAGTSKLYDYKQIRALFG